MANPWDAISDGIDSAAKKTDDDTASQISSLTHMTDSEIKALFPTKDDVQQLTTLMQIVNANTTQAQKQKKIIDNIQSIAGAVVKIVGKFA